MTRSKAALTHLLISTTLAAVVIGLILFGWYPPPYFWAMGGPMLIGLLVGVDVVLGPVLTLILFNPRKSRRELTLDLSLIGAVQLAALLYGLHSGYVGRMVYGAFVEDRFRLVQASEIAPALLEKAAPEFRTLPFAGHRIIGTQIPDTETARSDMTFYQAVGVGPQQMPQFYVPLAMNREQLRAAAIAQQVLRERQPELAAQIEQLLAARSLPWRDAAVLPFETDTATYTAVVELNTPRLLKVFTTPPR